MTFTHNNLINIKNIRMELYLNVSMIWQITLLLIC